MPVFDNHTIIAVLGVACASGLIGLDRTAVGQFMVSQPIVAAPFIGLMLGDAVTGLLIGAVLELIWVLDLPVGTFVPADSTVAAIVATAAAILGSPGGALSSVIGFTILLSTALAPVTIAADRVVRTYNARLADTLLAGHGADLGRRLARAHLSGLLVFFAKFFLLSLLFIPLGMWVVHLFLRMPDFCHRAMAQYLTVLPLLGAALMARKLSVKTADRFFLGGFTVAVVAGLFHAAAIIIVPLAVVAGWMGGRYRDRRA